MSANPMRTEYRELSDDEKGTIAAIKELAGALYETIDNLPNSRELALAKTNLEQSVMWAVKGITG